MNAKSVSAERDGLRERTCALPDTIHKQFELPLPELTLTKKLFGMASDDSIPADSQSSGVAVTEHNTHDPRLGTSSSLRRYPSHQIAWFRRDLPALPYTVPVLFVFPAIGVKSSVHNWRSVSRNRNQIAAQSTGQGQGVCFVPNWLPRKKAKALSQLLISLGRKIQRCVQ